MAADPRLTITIDAENTTADAFKDAESGLRGLGTAFQQSLTSVESTNKSLHEVTVQFREIAGSLQAVSRPLQSAQDHIKQFGDSMPKVAKTFGILADHLKITQSSAEKFSNSLPQAARHLSTFAENFSVSKKDVVAFSTALPQAASSLTTLADKLGKLDGFFDQLITSLPRLTEILEKVDKGFDEGGKEAKDFADQLGPAAASLGTLGEHLDVTEDDLQALSQNIPQVAELFSLLAEKTESLEDDFEGLERTLPNSSKAFELLTNEIVQMARAVTIGKGANAQSIPLFKALRDSVRSARTGFANLGKAVGSKTKRTGIVGNLADFADQFSEAGNAAPEFANALKELSGPSGILGSLGQQLGNVSDGVEQFNSAFSSNQEGLRNFSQALDKAKGEVTEWLSKIREKRESMNSLSTEFNKVARSTASFDTAVNKSVDALGNINDRLDASVNDFDQLAKQITASQVTLKTLQDQVGSIETTVGQWTSKLNENRETITNLTNTYKEIEQQTQEWRESLTKSIDELQETSQKIEQLGTKIDNFGTALESSATNVNKVSNNFNKLNDFIGTWVKSVEGSENTLAKLRTNLANSTSSLSGMATQLAANNKRFEKLGPTITNISGAFSTVNTTLRNDFIPLFPELKTALTNTKDKFGDLAKGTSEYTGELNELKDLTEYSRTILGWWTDALSSNAVSLGKLDNQLGDLLPEFSNWNTLLNSAQDNLNSLDQNIGQIAQETGDWAGKLTKSSDALDQVHQGLQGTVGGLTGLSNAISQNAGAFATIGQQVSGVLTHTRAWNDSLKSQVGTLKEVEGQLDQLKSGITNWSDSLDLATDQLLEFSGAFSESIEEAKQLKNALNSAKELVDDLKQDFNKTQEATNKFTSGLRQADTKVRNLGNQFTTTKNQAKDVGDAFDDAATRVLEVSEGFKTVKQSADLASGFILDAADAADNTRVSFEHTGTALDEYTDKLNLAKQGLTGFGPAATRSTKALERLGGFAGAAVDRFKNLNPAITEAKTTIEKWARSVGGTTKNMRALASEFQKINKSINEWREALDKATSIFGEIENEVKELKKAVAGFTDGIKSSRDTLGEWDRSVRGSAKTLNSFAAKAKGVGDKVSAAGDDLNSVNDILWGTDDASRQAGDGLDDLGDKAGKAGKKTKGLANTLIEQRAALLSAMFIVRQFIEALAELLKMFVEAAIKMESFRDSLKIMEGGAHFAAARLKELREIAELPGVQLESAVKATTTLKALSVSSELAKNIIIEFGNALALTGNQDFSGALLGLTQIIAKGKVHAEELNQLRERSAVFAKALEVAFGTTNSEKIQAFFEEGREEMIRFTRIFVKGLQTIGRAGEDTALNTLLNLNNAFFDLKATLGEQLLPIILKVVRFLTNVFKSATKLSEGMKGMISLVALLTAGITALAVVVGGLGLAFSGLAALLSATAAAWILAIPVVLALGAAIVLITNKFTQASREAEKFNKTTEAVLKRTGAVSNVDKRHLEESRTLLIEEISKPLGKIGIDFEIDLESTNIIEQIRRHRAFLSQTTFDELEQGYGELVRNMMNVEGGENAAGMFQQSLADALFTVDEAGWKKRLKNIGDALSIDYPLKQQQALASEQFKSALETGNKEIIQDTIRQINDVALKTVQQSPFFETYKEFAKLLPLLERLESINRRLLAYETGEATSARIRDLNVDLTDSIKKAEKLEEQLLKLEAQRFGLVLEEGKLEAHQIREVINRYENLVDLDSRRKQILGDIANLERDSQTNKEEDKATAEELARLEQELVVLSRAETENKERLRAVLKGNYGYLKGILDVTNETRVAQDALVKVSTNVEAAQTNLVTANAVLQNKEDQLEAAKEEQKILKKQHNEAKDYLNTVKQEAQTTNKLVGLANEHKNTNAEIGKSAENIRSLSQDRVKKAEEEIKVIKERQKANEDRRKTLRQEISESKKVQSEAKRTRDELVKQEIKGFKEVNRLALEGAEILRKFHERRSKDAAKEHKELTEQIKEVTESLRAEENHIDRIHKNIEELEAELAATEVDIPIKIEVSELQIRKLEIQLKELVDSLKVSATELENAFKRILDPFDELRSKDLPRLGVTEAETLKQFDTKAVQALRARSGNLEAQNEAIEKLSAKRFTLQQELREKTRREEKKGFKEGEAALKTSLDQQLKILGKGQNTALRMFDNITEMRVKLMKQSEETTDEEIALFRLDRGEERKALETEFVGLKKQANVDYLKAVEDLLKEQQKLREGDQKAASQALKAQLQAEEQLRQTYYQQAVETNQKLTEHVLNIKESALAKEKALINAQSQALEIEEEDHLARQELLYLRHAAGEISSTAQFLAEKEKLQVEYERKILDITEKFKGLRHQVLQAELMEEKQRWQQLTNTRRSFERKQANDRISIIQDTLQKIAKEEKSAIVADPLIKEQTKKIIEIYQEELRKSLKAIQPLYYTDLPAALAKARDLQYDFEKNVAAAKKGGDDILDEIRTAEQEIAQKIAQDRINFELQKLNQLLTDSTITVDLLNIRTSNEYLQKRYELLQEIYRIRSKEIELDKTLTPEGKRLAQEKLEYKTIQDKKDVLKTFREEQERALMPIAKIGTDFLDATFAALWSLPRQASEQLDKLAEETAIKVKEIQESQVLSEKQKARQIENIQRASAKKQRKINNDLNDHRIKSFQAVVTNFLGGIAEMLKAELQLEIVKQLRERWFPTQNVGNDSKFTVGSIFNKLFGNLEKKTDTETTEEPVNTSTTVKDTVMDKKGPNIIEDLLGTKDGNGSNLTAGTIHINAHNVQLTGTLATGLGTNSNEMPIGGFEPNIPEKGMTDHQITSAFINPSTIPKNNIGAKKLFGSVQQPIPSAPALNPLDSLKSSGPTAGFNIQNVMSSIEASQTALGFGQTSSASMLSGLAGAAGAAPGLGMLLFLLNNQGLIEKLFQKDGLVSDAFSWLGTQVGTGGRGIGEFANKNTRSVQDLAKGLWGISNFSFDNYYNDAMARNSGVKASQKYLNNEAKNFGHRSAADVVNNFTEGFVSSMKQQPNQNDNSGASTPMTVTAPIEIKLEVPIGDTIIKAHERRKVELRLQNRL